MGHSGAHDPIPRVLLRGKQEGLRGQERCQQKHGVRVTCRRDQGMQSPFLQRKLAQCHLDSSPVRPIWDLGPPQVQDGNCVSFYASELEVLCDSGDSKAVHRVPALNLSLSIRTMATAPMF